MKKAIFPNGTTIDITDDQAKKILFIQDCIKKSRQDPVAAAEGAAVGRSLENRVSN